MATLTNVVAADAPTEINKSGPDSRYYYEEQTILITFKNSANANENQIVQAYFVKNGRNVTVTLPALAVTFGSAGIYTCDPNSVPARFLPAVGGSGVSSATILCKTSNAGVEAIGHSVWKADGSVDIYPQIGFASTFNGLANVVTQNLSWNTPSAYNKAYPS